MWQGSICFFKNKHKDVRDKHCLQKNVPCARFACWAVGNNEAIFPKMVALMVSLTIMVESERNHQTNKSKMLWTRQSIVSGFSPTHLKTMLLKLDHETPSFGVKKKTLTWVATTQPYVGFLQNSFTLCKSPLFWLNLPRESGPLGVPVT